LVLTAATIDPIRGRLFPASETLYLARHTNHDFDWFNVFVPLANLGSILPQGAYIEQPLSCWKESHYITPLCSHICDCLPQRIVRAGCLLAQFTMSVSEKRSESMVGGDQLLAEDRRILRKVDRRLLPILTLLYLLSFLDRFVLCLIRRTLNSLDIPKVKHREC